MKILFSPVLPLNKNDKIKYDFIEKDLIKATMPNGETDTFDFRDLPDGRVGFLDIDSHLERIPVQRAKKIDGELYVWLTNFITTDASQEERFPDWVDYEEVD